MLRGSLVIFIARAVAGTGYEARARGVFSSAQPTSWQTGVARRVHRWATSKVGTYFLAEFERRGGATGSLRRTHNAAVFTVVVSAAIGGLMHVGSWRPWLVLVTTVLVGCADRARMFLAFLDLPSRIRRERRPDSAQIRSVIQEVEVEAPRPGSDHPVAAAWRRTFISWVHTMCGRYGYETYEVGHSKASYSGPGSLVYHWPRDLEAGAPRSDDFVLKTDGRVVGTSVPWCLVCTDTVEYHEELSDVIERAFTQTEIAPAVAVYAWALTHVAGRSAEGTYRFLDGEFNYKVGPTAEYRHPLWDVVSLPDRVVWRSSTAAIIYEPFHLPIGEGRVGLWLQPRVTMTGLYSLLYEPTVWRRVTPTKIPGTREGVADVNVLRLVHPREGPYISAAYVGATAAVDVSLSGYATLGFIKRAKRSGAQVALSREVVMRETKAPPELAGILAALGEHEEWHTPGQEYSVVVPVEKPLEVVGNSDGDVGVRVVAFGDDAADEGRKLRVMGMPTGVTTGIPVAAAVAGPAADAVAFAERVVKPATEAQEKVNARSVAHLKKVARFVVGKVGSGLVPKELHDVEIARLKRASQKRLIDEEAYAVQSSTVSAFLKTEPINVDPAGAGPASVSAPRNISHLAHQSIRWGAYMKALSEAFSKMDWYGFGRPLVELDQLQAAITGPESYHMETDFSKFDGTHTPEIRGVELSCLLAFFKPEYHSEIRELHALAADNELVSETGIRLPTKGTRLSGEAGTSTCNTLMNVMATLHVLATTARSWAPPWVNARDYLGLAWEKLIAYGGDDGLTVLERPRNLGTKAFLRNLEERYAGLGFKAKITLRRPGEPVTFLGRWRFPGVDGSSASPRRFLRSLEYTSKSAATLRQVAGSDDPRVVGAVAVHRKLLGYQATEGPGLLREAVENGLRLAEEVVRSAGARLDGTAPDAEETWKQEFSAGGQAALPDGLLAAVIGLEGQTSTPAELEATLVALATAPTWEAYCNPPLVQSPPGQLAGVQDLGDPMSNGSGQGRIVQAKKALKGWSARGRGRGRGRGRTQPRRGRA